MAQWCPRILQLATKWRSALRTYLGVVQDGRTGATSSSSAALRILATGAREFGRIRLQNGQCIVLPRANAALLLLTVIGAKTYETLRSLLAPERPRDKSCDELKAILLKHYDPQPLVIGERFRFYRRSQKSGESIADFVADLR